MMKRYALLLLILLAVGVLPAFAQDATPAPTIIPAPPGCCGDHPLLNGTIQQATLSPDGLHLAILTTYPDDMFASSLEVLSTTEAGDPLSLIPDLFRQDGFVWSPNSRYIAVTGNRVNGSGSEYNIIIYDLTLEPLQPGDMYPLMGPFFGEGVAWNDADNYQPDYAPVWSADSTLIAINFRDGIHFYQATDCTEDECLRYILLIGHVASFEWRGNTLITFGDNMIHIWDVSSVYHPQ